MGVSIMTTDQMEFSNEAFSVSNLRLDDVRLQSGLVGAVLEEYRMSQDSIDQLGKRHLGPWTKTLMWVLRAYVLFMIIVVIVNVVQSV